MAVINKGRSERSLTALPFSQKERRVRHALLVRQHMQAERARQAEDTQRIQEGMNAMQTDKIERLDDLSQANRKQLKEQIEHVQKEARKLRTQARRLRRAQNAETRQRKKLLEQMAEASKGWGQSMLQRGNDLATSGVSLATGQLRSGQQKALEYGGNLRQGMSQFGNQTTQNLTGWGGDTSSKLLKQGQQLSQSASDWGDETTYRLRKQGRQLAQNTSDWGDEAVYRLRKQGQSLFQDLADWCDEMVYRLRRQGRNLSRTAFDRKEDAARQLYRQKRDLGRNLSERREGATRQLRRQGRGLGRNLAGRREDAARQMRKQRNYLSERGGQLLEPVRQNPFWSVFGFVSGLLLAGGVTYWLVKRGLSKTLRQEEEGIELEVREPLDGVSRRPAGKVRSVNRGGAVVATRPATVAGPTTQFVGVLSSRRYYPLERKPDERDLVFFESEEDARSEGFTAAE